MRPFDKAVRQLVGQWEKGAIILDAHSNNKWGDDPAWRVCTRIGSKVYRGEPLPEHEVDELVRRSSEITAGKMLFWKEEVK